MKQLHDLVIDPEYRTIQISTMDQQHEFKRYETEDDFKYATISIFKDWLDGKLDVGTANKMNWANHFYNTYTDLVANDLTIYEAISNYRKKNPSDWEYPDSRIISDYLTNSNSINLENKILETLIKSNNKQDFQSIEHFQKGYVTDIQYKRSNEVPTLPIIEKIQYSKSAIPNTFSSSEREYIQNILGKEKIIAKEVGTEREKMKNQFFDKSIQVSKDYRNFRSKQGNKESVVNSLNALSDYYFLNGEEIALNHDSQKIVNEIKGIHQFNSEDTTFNVAERINEFYFGNNLNGFSRKLIESYEKQLPDEYLNFDQREIVRMIDWKNQFKEKIPQHVQNTINSLSLKEGIVEYELSNTPEKASSLKSIYELLPPSIKDYALEKESSFQWSELDDLWVKKEKALHEIDTGIYELQDSDFDKSIQKNNAIIQQENNGIAEFNKKEKDPFDYNKANAEEISAQALKLIRSNTSNPQDLKEYLDFMSNFYQYSPRNSALIQEQWKGANQVATFDQWKKLGDTLGIKSDDVDITTKKFKNQKTGKETIVTLDGLSVRSGEKSQITLFRPLMNSVIPKLDESGKQIKENGKPVFKNYKYATAKDKQLIKQGVIKVAQVQARDKETGSPLFSKFKVFEISQTNLKPESYPKAMPNRHENFKMDNTKGESILEGIRSFAQNIGISFRNDLSTQEWDSTNQGNSKGFFAHNPNGKVINGVKVEDSGYIYMNPRNTTSESISVAFHELTHGVLHNQSKNPAIADLPNHQKELEAELSSYISCKHFGIDTEKSSIDYMANWTNNLQKLDDKDLSSSLRRVHNTSANIIKKVEETISQKKNIEKNISDTIPIKQNTQLGVAR